MQRCIPIDSLFLLEILEREAIGILHDLLHFRLCHLQLFIAEASDVDGIAENLHCLIQRKISLFQHCDLILQALQPLFE